MRKRRSMGGPGGPPIVLPAEPEPIGALARQVGMRTMTLALVCLVVLLSACAYGGRSGAGGSSPGAGDSGSKDDPISATPGGVPSPPPGDGATREEPDPTVVDPHGVAVDHFAIGADGRTVVVYWWGGNTTCFGLKEVTVTFQHNTPVVAVQEGTRADHVGQACTMEAVLKSTVVTLDEPILADAVVGYGQRGEPELPSGATAVDPQDGVVDAVPHAIGGYALSADGLTLTAYYVGGVEECYGLAAATADRAAGGLVTVSIREGALPNVDGPCIDLGVAKVTGITLDQPLIVVAAFDSGGGNDY
ncbi:MAG TPA: hypothetical protein VJY85_01100 [Candidatus Limnocylindria bacterium]|nr:hypothetical protein [Candidatus Limnocylindria bacterium]